MLRKLNFNQIFIIGLAFLLIGVEFVLSIYAQEGQRGYWKERRLSKQQGKLIQSVPTLNINGKKVKHIKTITNDGGRVDWSHSGNNLIAFDRMEEDGYYDVYVMNPDGSGEKCLTCGKQGLPQKHNGNPAWHLSGE